MRATITLRDLRDGKVEMITGMDEVTAAEHNAPPSPSAVIMVGAMALYEAGILAEAGETAVKAIEEGKSPVDAVRESHGRTN